MNLGDEWRTPKWLYAYAIARFGPFDTDACSTPENALCARRFEDALVADWGRAAAGRVWCNPPYSKPLQSQVIDRALQAEDLDAVFLVPATTDTRYFFNLVNRARTVIFLKGRVAFLDHEGRPVKGTRFASALIHVAPGGGKPAVEFRDIRP